jgi:hypothetical protein
MPGCQKCWNDAGRRAMNTMSDKADIYHDLIEERTGPLECTPEEQAGDEAEVCVDCDRKTVHEVHSSCMVCGKDYAEPTHTKHLREMREQIERHRDG